MPASTNTAIIARRPAFKPPPPGTADQVANARVPRYRRAGRNLKGRIMGIISRWLGAFVLLAAIFNPTDWNFVTWARANWTDQMPVIVFAGLILGVVMMVYLVATMRSIGLLGAIIIAAIFAAFLWVLTDWGLLALGNSDVTVWLAIFALSLILGIGLSWSILRQRLSGQASVDEIEG